MNSHERSQLAERVVGAPFTRSTGVAASDSWRLNWIVLTAWLRPAVYTDSRSALTDALGIRDGAQLGAIDGHSAGLLG